MSSPRPRQERNFMSKQPSPDDLAKAIEFVNGRCYCTKDAILMCMFCRVTTIAKRSQELQEQIGVCSACGFKAWSNEENQTSHCLYCELEQSSLKQSALIEKLVEEGELLSSGVWSCCADGEHSPERDYCIPGKRFKEALSLAHSKGYGKK